MPPRRRVQQRPQPRGMGASFVMFLTFFIMIIMMAYYPVMGKYLGPVVYKGFSFGIQTYPVEINVSGNTHIGYFAPGLVLSMYAFAAVFGGITTMIMEATIDWRAQAILQHKSKQLQKKWKEAVRSKNTYLMKKLQEKQMELMQEQQKVMKNQMYTYPVTMLLIIPFFAGLWGMLNIMAHGSHYLLIHYPWTYYWNLLDTRYLFPNWIILYSGFSFVLTTLLRRGIEFLRFRKVCREMGIL